MKTTLSFIIPAKNESESVGQLYSEIVSVCGRIKKSFEIIFVDDGSTDRTFSILEGLRKKDSRVKVIKLRGNWGKSLALQAGFDNSQGEIIFTMDADLQDNPKEIPNFLRKIDQGYDLVSGWKKVRHDPWHKVFPSRILNFITRKLTNTELHDINCGFKAYRKDVISNLNLYGELYRFIPILIAKQNYKVTEIEISHKERRFGKSKFGIERNLKGLIDLITIIFLTGYLRRPGHFFGFLGFFSFSIGFIIGLYITYLRVTTGSIQDRHPLLFLGMLLMIIGVQLVTTGLIAELIIYKKTERREINNIDIKLL